MLLALALVASLGDWVPMRWASSDPQSLTLLQGTPVKCLLLEKPQWSAPFLDAASRQNVVTLGVVRPAADALEIARAAMAKKLDGVVLEGDFEPAVSARIRGVLSDSKFILIELPPRARMRFDGEQKIVGTYQGVWPGIQIEEGGSAKAAPSGAPWINTNSGFLRFVRASTDSHVWMGYTPPTGTVVTTDRYLQAVGDAAMVGARWIVALDDDLSKRLYAREADAVKEWARIAVHAAYFEAHKDWRVWKPLSELAIVQDVDSGALLSGGVLDMIAVKHTPVLTVPNRRMAAAMVGAKLAVNVDPSSLTAEQKDSLRAFARSGGTLLSGAAGWKFPLPTAESITLGEAEVKKLDEIWKELNTMTGRRNLGVRLFNVSSMLSNLLQSPNGKGAALHLVNYSGYPVENVTVHLLGKYKSAHLLAPGVAPKKIETYENEEGTGVDIATIGVSATLVLE